MKIYICFKWLLVILASLLIATACVPNTINTATTTPTTVIEPTRTPTITPSPIPSFTPTAITVEGEIKKVIGSYFETRYQMFSTLQLKGFGNLISNSPEAESFLSSEMQKLEIEIKHSELEHLRYVQYEILLDYKDISIESYAQSASVLVVEGNNVIFELSQTLSPENPIVSKMRNMEHVVLLHLEEGKWKIISDYYNDYLWRILRSPGVSADEMLRSMNDSIQMTATAIADMPFVTLTP